MGFRTSWQQRVRQLKRDALTIYFIYRNPRTPWYTRLLAFAVAGYLFSPLDLIPDWIPVLGYLDDLLIVPLGILLVIKITPQDIIAESRARAEALCETSVPLNRLAATGIIITWLVLGGVITVWLLHHHYHHHR